MPDNVDQTARDRASEAVHGLNNHIMVTDIKLSNLEKKMDAHHVEHNDKLDRLESILKWAGGLIVMLFISTLTWSLAQQYNNNETAKRDLQQQMQLLQEQERARQASRTEILSRLPAASASETTTAP